MDLGQSSFLAITAVFAIGALLVEGFLVFETVWPYRRLVAAVVLIGVLHTAVTEYVQVQWHLWDYGYERMLGSQVFDVAVEIYLGSFVAGIAVGSATAAFTRCQDLRISLLGAYSLMFWHRVRKLRHRRQPTEVKGQTS